MRKEYSAFIVSRPFLYIELKKLAELKLDGLNEDEIKVIMNEKLEIYLEYCVYALQVSFVGSFTGNRQAEILVVRYGLNGNNY